MTNSSLRIPLVLAGAALTFSTVSMAADDVPWATDEPNSVVLNLCANQSTYGPGSKVQIKLVLHARAPVKTLDVSGIAELAVAISESGGRPISRGL